MAVMCFGTLMIQQYLYGSKLRMLKMKAVSEDQSVLYKPTELRFRGYVSGAY